MVKTDLKELKYNIKQMILDDGAKIVGVGSQERLKDAPPSGDMNFCLPGAQSCIIWAYPNPIEALENYFSKTERMSIKKTQDFAYVGAWKTAQKVAKYIEENTEFNAFPVIPNAKYREVNGKRYDFRKDDYAWPDFSLRYGAVAAGLGHLGWSGNLVTKEYGGSLYLGGVLTTASLEPDPMAEENNCNGCKICVKACSTGYFPLEEEETRQEVIIGGSKEVYARRGTYSKCGIGCAGWTGLSLDGTWSTWTPDHISLKKYSHEEWKKNRGLRRDIVVKLLRDPTTPREIRKFNQKILASFAKVGITENVGLRPLRDTNPRCGNCNFICVADPKKRKELYNLLISSGKVFIDKKGREYIEKIVDGKEVIHYPITEEEYFSKSELK